MQFDINSRNGFLNVINSSVGPSGVLYIRSGAPPATCADADTGTELLYIQLPNEPFTIPTIGYIEKSGIWSCLSAQSAGVAGHYRIMSASTCCMQGVCSEISGGGEMQLSTVNIQISQPVTVSVFVITAPGQ